jgi:hypothetical protein
MILVTDVLRQLEVGANIVTKIGRSRLQHVS